MISGYRKSITTKVILLAAGLVILWTVLLIGKYFQCEISEEESKGIAKNFLDRVQVDYSSEPMHVQTEPQLLSLGAGTNRISVGDTTHYNLLVEVDCKNKEVVHFSNRKLLENNRRRHSIRVNKTLVVRWPRFIEEKEAREIVHLIASKVSLPEDAEFNELNLKKIDGIWVARWKKEYKGFYYEKDYITILVSATNGEFYAYNKTLHNKPCLQKVIITKAEAEAIAQRSFSSYFSEDQWLMNKDKFKIQSSLVISELDGLGRLVHYNRPKLVWLIVFDTREGMDRSTVGILVKDRSVIKVDPATGKVLSRHIEIVR